MLIETALNETDSELRIAAIKRLQLDPEIKAIVNGLRVPDVKLVMRANYSLSKMDDGSLSPILRAEQRIRTEEKIRLKLEVLITTLEAKYRFY